MVCAMLSHFLNTNKVKELRVTALAAPLFDLCVGKACIGSGHGHVVSKSQSFRRWLCVYALRREYGEGKVTKLPAGTV